MDFTGESGETCINNNLEGDQMKSAEVLVYDEKELVHGTKYEVDGYLIQTDLKKMAEDSLSRCSKSWTKCGVADDRGILMAIFDKNMDEIERINPNEDYWRILQELAKKRDVPVSKKKRFTMKDNDLITVCDACFRACCWQGEFMCEGARNAGTTEKSVAELRKMKLDNEVEPESEDYWKPTP